MQQRKGSLPEWRAIWGNGSANGGKGPLWRERKCGASIRALEDAAKLARIAPGRGIAGLPAAASAKFMGAQVERPTSASRELVAYLCFGSGTTGLRQRPVAARHMVAILKEKGQSFRAQLWTDEKAYDHLDQMAASRQVVLASSSILLILCTP
jgi:hypothetical protein